MGRSRVFVNKTSWETFGNALKKLWGPPRHWVRAIYRLSKQENGANVSNGMQEEEGIDDSYSLLKVIGKMVVPCWLG